LFHFHGVNVGIYGQANIVYEYIHTIGQVFQAGQHLFHLISIRKIHRKQKTIANFCKGMRSFSAAGKIAYAYSKSLFCQGVAAGRTYSSCSAGYYGYRLFRHVAPFICPPMALADRRG
jgi:hypothetical protein